MQLRLYPPLRRLSGFVFMVLLGALFLVIFAGGAAGQDGDAAPVHGGQAASPDIVGGREAIPGAWPWQVALVVRTVDDTYDGQFCGGTLIASDWVLTAAHCVDGTEASLVDALVGAHRLTDGGHRVTADHIIVHPAFDPYYLDSDLALIHLTEAVTQTPISLYKTVPDRDEISYVRGTITGWGVTDPSGSWLQSANSLHEVSLPLVDHDRCLEAWWWGITDNMICAGYNTLAKGACYGDSGGPLMVQETDGTWRQVGIVSFGPYMCYGYYIYDVFTRVAPFTEWIEACMADMDAMLCSGADIFEPDDDSTMAREYNPFGQPEIHTMHASTDQDWVKFDVEIGKTYLIQTMRDISPGFVPYVNTAVWLYEVDGRTPITYNDDSPAPYEISNGLPAAAIHQGLVSEDSLSFAVAFEDSRIMWRADRTGPVFAAVELLPDIYGPSPGSRTRYQFIISEYPDSYIPVVGGPPPDGTISEP
ncbi:MAG: serine protease [Caldilineaceae bacterium]|nr:serine protease [Caldilineaceae bacterium]